MAMIKTTKQGWVSKVTVWVHSVGGREMFCQSTQTGAYQSVGYIAANKSIDGPMTDDVERAKAFATAPAAKGAGKAKFTNTFGHTLYLVGVEAEFVDLSS